MPATSPTPDQIWKTTAIFCLGATWMVFLVTICNNLADERNSNQRPRYPLSERSERMTTVCVEDDDRLRSRKKRSRSCSRCHKGHDCIEDVGHAVFTEDDSCFFCNNEKKRHQRQGRAWPSKKKKCFFCGKTAVPGMLVPEDHFQPKQRKDTLCHLSGCKCSEQCCRRCTKCEPSSLSDSNSISIEHKCSMQNEAGETLHVAAGYRTSDKNPRAIIAESIWTDTALDDNRQFIDQHNTSYKPEDQLVSSGDRESLGDRLSSWFWVPRDSLKV